MTTEKIVSYTPEQTDMALGMYAAGQTVEAIAVALSKTTHSVIGKLVREKVYQPRVKAVATRVTKATLIAAIAVKFGASPEALESLEKASKEALQILAGEI